MTDYNAKHLESEDVIATSENGVKVYRTNEERESLYKQAVAAPRIVANLKGDLAGAEFRLTIKKKLDEGRQAVSAALACQQAVETARESVPAVPPPTGGCPGHVNGAPPDLSAEGQARWVSGGPQSIRL